MPMSYSEMKSAMLNEYNFKLSEWHHIVGAMFEATNGFTKRGIWAIHIRNSMYRIEWDNYSWNIEEIGLF